MQTRMLKFRLYPNKTQKQILEQTLENCRLVYNYLLAAQKTAYEEMGKLISQYDQNHELTQLKNENPALSDIHSQVLQNISKRIRDAYHGFFERRKLGLKTGSPRFKKCGRYKSITYPQSGFKVEGKKLTLSKIGSINVKLHRPIKGDIKTLTVKRMPSGKWFATFSSKITPEPKEKSNSAVGIDVGLHHFATLSDGQIVENPRHLRKAEGKLTQLQRCLSRKKRRSRNRDKAQIKVAQLHEKIVNQRNDFLHKISRKLADSYSAIFIEDLQIGNMMQNHKLAKSIADASWGRFTQMLSYKAEEAGGKVIKVDPKGTTQTCNRCGLKTPKTLAERIHLCPQCGLEVDRDLNASRNILKNSVGTTGITLAEIEPLLSRQAQSLKQEATLLVGW